MSENSVVLPRRFPFGNAGRSDGSEIHDIRRGAWSMRGLPRFNHILPAFLPIILIMISLQCSGSSSRSSSASPGTANHSAVVVTVVDENGVAVPSVQITL